VKQFRSCDRSYKRTVTFLYIEIDLSSLKVLI
jgi:hypothetical protein